MTPTWDDAADALAWLQGRRAAADTLVLLHRLRFLERNLLHPLLGVSPSLAARAAADLLAAGLVDGFQPRVGMERPSTVLHLSDLGLAALGLAWREDPRRLAADARVRRTDLLAACAGLPGRLDVRRLAARVGAARPGPARLVGLRDWREPWVPPVERGRARVCAPACATFAWTMPDGSEESHAYVLVPDPLELLPLAEFRTLARGLSELRDLRAGGGFPLLVVAASTPDRLARWAELLRDPYPARRAAPLAWAPVLGCRPPAGGDRPATREDPAAPRGARLVWGPGEPLAAPPPPHPSPARAGQRPAPRPGKAIPRPVGQLPGPRPTEGAPLRRRAGHAALQLSPSDLRLLDWLATWPFATDGELGDLAGFRRRVARRMREHLIGLGLARRLGPGDLRWPSPTSPLCPPRAEVTRAGGVLVAGQRRLTVNEAAARDGISGGGPGLNEAFGQRGQLLEHFAHTCTVTAVLGALVGTLRRSAAARGKVLRRLECRSTGACRDGGFQPDAHVLFRVGDPRGAGGEQDEAGEFYFELERGTARGRGGYPAKFAQYHRYYAAHHAAGDRYVGPPVLVLLDHHKDPRWALSGRSGKHRERRRASAARLRARVAAAVQGADARCGRRLPVYLATLLDVVDDPAGLAGAVWWRVDGDGPAPPPLALPPANLRSVDRGRLVAAAPRQRRV